jgi:hypothetical protein
MAASEKPSPRREIKVRLPNEIAPGCYANALLVQHTREEFILDFTFVTDRQGTVVARVVVSPGHMKRVLAALQANLTRYESSHGHVEPAPERPLKLGFQPPEDD